MGGSVGEAVDLYVAPVSPGTKSGKFDFYPQQSGVRLTDLVG